MADEPVRDDLQRGTAIDRYWDAVANGRLAEPDRDLEERLAATIRRVHALAGQPLPEPDHVEQLWEDLMHAESLSMPQPPPPFVANGHALGPSHAWPALRTAAPGHSRTAALATAALVLLTLLSSFVVFGGPGRLGLYGNHPVFVPALETTPAMEATPEAGEVVVVPLVVTTVPPEELPTEPPLNLQVWHATITPGAEVAFTPAMVKCCEGPQVDHVLSGVVTLRSEGPVRVTRAVADGTPGPVEDVPPGTEVVLRPGDSAISRAEMPSTYVNAGSDPVDLASGALVHGFSTAQPTGYQVNNDTSASVDASLMAEPITLVFEQATLPPDGVLPAPPAGASRGIVSWPQIAVMMGAGDGSVINKETDPVVVYVLTAAPTGTAGPPAAVTPTP